jgi:hypothetical protein
MRQYESFRESIQPLNDVCDDFLPPDSELHGSGRRSRASSFGSCDSGISHPPNNTAAKKVVSSSFSQLSNASSEAGSFFANAEGPEEHIQEGQPPLKVVSLAPTPPPLLNCSLQLWQNLIRRKLKGRELRARSVRDLELGVINSTAQDRRPLLEQLMHTTLDWFEDDRDMTMMSHRLEFLKQLMDDQDQALGMMTPCFVPGWA